MFVEIVVSDQILGPVIFVSGAVNFVTAALGEEGHLRAGGTSLIGASVGRGDAKFLNGVERRTQCSAKGKTAQLVVVVHTV